MQAKNNCGAPEVQAVQVLVGVITLNPKALNLQLLCCSKPGRHQESPGSSRGHAEEGEGTGLLERSFLLLLGTVKGCTFNFVGCFIICSLARKQRKD